MGDPLAQKKEATRRAAQRALRLQELARRAQPGEAVGLAAALPDPLDWSPGRPGRRLLARGAAIRANMQGVPVGLPLPCGAGRA